MEKINVLIAEDHPFTRQALVYDLKKTGRINVLAAFETGKAVVDFVKKTTPDIILMDIVMPELDGIEAAREIKKFNPNIPVIILTAYEEKKKVFGAFSSGANAYCVKKIEMDELLKVVEIVLNGGVWFDKRISGYIYDTIKSMDENLAEDGDKKSVKKLEDFNISTRERNVLKLMSEGLSNEEIANELVISQNTVRNHVASIINKLSVKDRTQAVILTLKNNLLG